MDFARSSSANSAGGTSDGLQAFPFALDTLVMVTDNTTNAPATITGADLPKIYDGTYDTWNDIPGNAAGSTAAIAPEDPAERLGDTQLLRGPAQVAQRRGRRHPGGHGGRGAGAQPGGHRRQPERHRAVLTGPQRRSCPRRCGWSRASRPSARSTTWCAAVRSATPPSRRSSATRGFFCSTAARSLHRGFWLQAARSRADGGVCGVPTQAATSNFTLNERVVTTTTLTRHQHGAQDARS